MINRYVIFGADLDNDGKIDKFGSIITVDGKSNETKELTLYLRKVGKDFIVPLKPVRSVKRITPVPLVFEDVKYHKRVVVRIFIIDNIVRQHYIIE